MAGLEHHKQYGLPDETALLEAHLWDNLQKPHPADAGKDVREWVMKGLKPVLIINDCLVEVIEQRGAAHGWWKFEFKTTEAAFQFGEMMAEHATVIGLLSF